MNEEILTTIDPKSDQLNADDLLGSRTITIKITEVSISGEDQPVAIRYEGDKGKPYKPCKSMRRILVTVWGSAATSYVGRLMTLYRDDKVTFGGVAVGGIRISHMSGIDKDVTVALTASRGIRKPYTVRPLAGGANFGYDAAGHRAAEEGMAALQTFWQSLTPAQKVQVGGAAQLESWKRTAAGVPQAHADAGVAAGAAESVLASGWSKPVIEDVSASHDNPIEERTAARNRS